MRCLTTLLCLLFALSLAAQDERREPEPLVLAKDADVATVAMPTTELAKIRRLFADVLPKLPDGYRARMTFQQHWSNHPDHYGLNTYPRSIVPLDPAGEPDGIERVYDTDLRLTAEIPWRHGQRHGVEKHLAGKTAIAEIPWIDGQLHGERRTFHPNGKPQALTTYAAGEATGMTRTWDATGNLLREAPMQRGERHGELRDYWPGTDQVRRAIPYDLGKVNGTVREYYANGQLKRDVGYVANELHGVEHQYEADGSLIRRRWWLNGQPATEEAWEREAPASPAANAANAAQR